MKENYLNGFNSYFFQILFISDLVWWRLTLLKLSCLQTLQDMKLIEMTRDENFCNLKSSHFCCSIQMHRSTFHFLFQRSVAFVNNLIHNEFLTLKLYWHFILQLKMLFSLFQGNKTEMLIPNVQSHSWYDVWECCITEYSWDTLMYLPCQNTILGVTHGAPLTRGVKHGSCSGSTPAMALVLRCWWWGGDYDTMIAKL